MAEQSELFDPMPYIRCKRCEDPKDMTGHDVHIRDEMKDRIDRDHERWAEWDAAETDTMK